MLVHLEDEIYVALVWIFQSVSPASEKISPNCDISLHVHFGGKIDCFLWLQQIFTTTRSIYHPVSVCK